MTLDEAPVVRVLGEMLAGFGVVRPSGVLRRHRRYERKLWMRDLVMGVAYPPVDH